MKLSFKIILPIILISALLILLNGCTGTVPDEEPGYTPGTITGIIAAPCCSTSAETVSETSGSPEYWCYYCQETWKLQDGIKVVLTYGEEEVATVYTNEDGEFTFTNVDPGKNYVVTAYCPGFGDNRPLVKDVALQLIEGGSFDTNITDLVSTSLGLVVDFLVLYTDWGPEDISLDAVLADRPDFINFPRFKKLVYEVRRVVENCEVNLLTDDAVQDALCRAAEEISKLEIGCGPGFTPGPGPGPEPCDGDVRPEIDQVEGVDQVLLNGSPVSSGSTLSPIIVGTPIEFCVYATDPDNKLAQPLTYSISGSKDGNPFNFQMGTVNCVSGTPLAEEVGTYIVYVNVSDGCLTTPWGPITVNVDDECYNNEPPVLTVPADLTVYAGDTYTAIASATDDGIRFGTDLVFSASIAPSTTTNNLTIDPSTGEINWVTDCLDIVNDDLTNYLVTVKVDDGCEPVEKSFTITLDPEKCNPCYDNTAPEVIVPDDSLGIFVAAGSTYDADIFMSDIDLIKDPLTHTISISPLATNSLVITPITGGVHISWDTDCADIVDGVNTEYTITIEAFDGCAQTIKSFTITLLAEPCVLCSLSLQVKEGGELVEYLDDLPFTATVSGDITYITYDDITVGTNASKLWFRICASPDAEMVYNFYRGGSCPDEWDYDDGSVGTPPGWSPVLDSKFNTQYYPDGYPKPSPDDLIICNTGDPNEPVNILMVKVTDGNLITIYTFNIFR